MDKQILQKIILEESKMRYMGEKYSNDMLKLYDFVEENEYNINHIIDLINEYYEIL